MRVIFTIVVAALLWAAVVVRGLDADEEEISKLLKETDFIKMLEQNAEKQDRRLEELHHRLEAELARVNQHFEDMLEKIHQSEESLQKNLEKVEVTVLGKVQDVGEKARESQGGWRLPFFVLLLGLLGVAGFFARLYQKATKHNHIF